MSCPVCYAEYNEFKSIKPQCGHEACSKCFTNWALEQIKRLDYQDRENISCSSGCGCYINVVEFINDLTEDQREPIYEALLSSYLKKSEDIRICPKDGCNYAGIFDFSKKCSDKLECMKCGHQWLDKTQISMAAHAGSSFDEFKSRLWEYLFTKSCPTCHYKIHKIGGCSHMTCARCSDHFCWLCVTSYSKHNVPYCLMTLLTKFMFKGLVVAAVAYYFGYFKYIVRGLKTAGKGITLLTRFGFKVGIAGLSMKAIYHSKNTMMRRKFGGLLPIVGCLGLNYYYGYPVLFKAQLLMASFVTMQRVITIVKNKLEAVPTQVSEVLQGNTKQSLAKKLVIRPATRVLKNVAKTFISLTIHQNMK